MIILYLTMCAANLGRLEAVRVSSEGEIEDLKMQISRLQQTIASLERERGALQSSQTSANESQAKRLKSLHQVILYSYNYIHVHVHLGVHFFLNLFMSKRRTHCM